MAKIKRAEVLASLKMVGERLSTSRPLPSESDDAAEKLAPDAESTNGTSSSVVESASPIAEDREVMESAAPIEFADGVHASLVEDIDSVGELEESGPSDSFDFQSPADVTDTVDTVDTIDAPAAAAMRTDALPTEDAETDGEELPLPEKDIINIWAPEMRMPTDPVPPIRPSSEALESYQFSRSKPREDDCVARAFQTIEQYKNQSSATPDPDVKPKVTSYLTQPEKPAPAKQPPAWIDPPDSSSGPAVSFAKDGPVVKAEEVNWDFNFEEEPEGIGAWLPKRGLPAGLVLTLAVAVCLAVFFISGATSKGSSDQSAVKASPPAQPPAAAAPSNETVRSEIQAAYDQLYKSRASNVAAYMRLLTLDFVYTDRNGKSSFRGETESTVKKGLAFWKSVNSWGTELVDLSVDGDQATATIIEEFENFFRDSDGRYGQRGARHQFKSTGMKFRDNWVKSPEGWKLARSQALTPAVETVDGRPAKG